MFFLFATLLHVCFFYVSILGHFLYGLAGARCRDADSATYLKIFQRILLTSMKEIIPNLHEMQG